MSIRNGINKRGCEMGKNRAIHWCLVCNLLTTSKKCPICRNEASRLDLEPSGHLVPLSQNMMLPIRTSIDSTYGEGCGEALLPDNCVAFLDRSKKRSDIIVNGGKIGSIVDGKTNLDLSGLDVISDKLTKHVVKCDHNSSFFIKKGHSLMVTGVKEASPDLQKGDRVCILNDRGRAIAVATMKMTSQEIASSDRGVAASIAKSGHARTCYNVPHRNWVKTLELNQSTVSSTAGMAIGSIKELASSYSNNIVVELSKDIRSEASLLLTIDAGFIPKVLVHDRDEFMDYLIERFVLTVVDSVPDKCLLIADSYDGQSPDVVYHSPTSEWEPSMIWMYIMMKAVPFHPSHSKNL